MKHVENDIERYATETPSPSKVTTLTTIVIEVAHARDLPADYSYSADEAILATTTAVRDVIDKAMNGNPTMRATVTRHSLKSSTLEYPE